MKRIVGSLLLCLAISAVVLGVLYSAKALTEEEQYDTNPPFELSLLDPDTIATDISGGQTPLFGPKNPYNIFINYELGMHCVGFDISYCCIIPPYNSIQSQAVQSGLHGEKPHLLTGSDGVKLYYSVRDNSYSEGNKMRYWRALKDVSGTGTMDSPGDNMANYVWTHLFIYKDMEGTLPSDAGVSKRLRIGKEIPVNIDAGPSGKSITGGYMDYSGEGGGISFSRIPCCLKLKTFPSS